MKSTQNCWRQSTDHVAFPDTMGEVKCVYNRTIPFDSRSMESQLGTLLADPSVQRLFRIFLLLSIKERQTDNLLSQKIDKSEIELILEVAFHKLGWTRTLHRDRFDARAKLMETVEKSVGFRSFLEVCQQAIEVDKRCFEELVYEMYDELVNQVFLKGYLAKKNRRATSTWKSAWCVVLPGRMLFYKDRFSKSPDDLVQLAQESRLMDETTSGDSKTENKFSVTTQNKKKLFMARSAVAKHQWLWAISLAIARCSSATNVHRERFLLSKAGPATTSIRLRPSPKPDNRVSELKDTLEHTALVLRKRDEEFDEERTRNRRLSQEVDEMGRRLVTQQQAMKDEEIVRLLATRLLEEERLKNEELERQVRLCEVQLQHSHMENKILSQQLRLSLSLPDIDRSDGERYDFIQSLQDMTSEAEV